jgi:TRAP-type C4-dicarboxylate transport system permease small subunit
MKYVLAVDRGLAKAETVLLVIFLGIMVMLAFAQVMLRNLFGTGLLWGDTIVRHMVLWAGFIGGALASYEGRHISIDALTKYLSPRVKHATSAITHLFAGVVCYYLASASWTFLTAEMEAGGEFVLSLPGWTAMAIIPAGYVMILLHFFLKVIEHGYWTVHPPVEGDA